MSYVMLEYQCPGGHRQESLELRSEPAASLPCVCGELAERTISAVRFRQPLGWVTPTGAKEERPPGTLDTRPLAEGMSVKEWRKSREGQRRDEVRRGLVDPQVFV